MRFIFLPCALCLMATVAFAAPDEVSAKVAPGVPPYTVPAGELGLEGKISGVNGANGEITIAATAFSTPSGRKAIEPAKPKLLITTGQTLIFDERTGRVLDFSDVVPGWTIRVVGQNVGDGLPLRARLVLWRSPAPAVPPDAEAPAAIAELLPPPASFKGVTVRVLNAGFASPSQIFENEKAGTPLFFVGYKVSASDDFAGNALQTVKLQGVTAPNGEKFGFYNSGQIRGTHYYGNSYRAVDPRWKSVTANFEVTLPNAPPGADGNFEDKYRFETPLPTRDNPTLEPNQVVTTPHGTTFTLRKIVTDYNKNNTRVTVSVRPAAVPGAVAAMKSVAAVAVATTGGKVNQPNLSEAGNPTEMTFDFPAVEPDTPTLRLFFTATESAPAWKNAEFFRALDVPIPVAALVKANPPALDGADALPNYLAENEAFFARLDVTTNGDLGVESTLWLRPKTTPNATKTAVRQVPGLAAVRALTDDGTSVRVYPNENRRPALFHNDGSAPTPDETAFAIDLPRFAQTPDGPVQMQFDLTSAAQFTRSFDGLVSVPALGAPSPNAPKQEGALRLQRAAQVEANGTLAAEIKQRTEGRINLGERNAFLMVFDVERALPDSTFALDNFVFDGVAFNRFKASLWNGNALADQKTGAVTLTVGPQAAKPAQIHFDLIEKTADKKEPLLIIKNVAIKAIE